MITSPFSYLFFSCLFLFTYFARYELQVDVLQYLRCNVMVSFYFPPFFPFVYLCLFLRPSLLISFSLTHSLFLSITLFLSLSFSPSLFLSISLSVSLSYSLFSGRQYCVPIWEIFISNFSDKSVPGRSKISQYVIEIINFLFIQIVEFFFINAIIVNLSFLLLPLCLFYSVFD